MENAGTVRIQYPDLIGTERGRDLPSEVFGSLSGGLHFCRAVYYTTTQGGTLDGEHSLSDGLPDVVFRPDRSTLAPMPWEPGYRSCLGDMLDPVTGLAIGECPRGAVKAAVERLSGLGSRAVIGPELEFFVLSGQDGAWSRYGDSSGNVYRVGHRGDPDGLAPALLTMLRAAELDVTAVNHEFAAGQFEVNLGHSTALDAADRAFRFKHAVREFVAQRGLTATFVGKPFNEEGGSGFHLHVSLLDENGRNQFAADGAPAGLSATARHAVGGILRHAPALCALLAPTVNAYRRLGPDTLAPALADWGMDNRSTMVRVPPERGAATRLEVRLGDAAASPYLAVAGVLAAVALGIEGRIEPPDPTSGYGYDAARAPALPETLDAALDALAADDEFADAVGKDLVAAFDRVKRDETARFRRWVTDWELREYLPHL
ncbi:glutamine synthetase family protein [Amycolatopsis lurida]